VGTQKTIKKQTDNRSYHALTPLARLVRPIIKGLLPARSVVFQQLFEAWPDLVKGTEAEGSIPEKLTFAKGQQSSGQLAVWTLTSAQAMEINFAQRDLLHKINAFFGSNVVAELRVTAYPTSLRAVSESPMPQEAASQTRSKIPSQSLDKMGVQISNPTLRSLLSDFEQVLDSPNETTASSLTQATIGETHA
jgi:hypothetical protein